MTWGQFPVHHTGDSIMLNLTDKLRLPLCSILPATVLKPFLKCLLAIVVP